MSSYSTTILWHGPFDLAAAQSKISTRVESDPSWCQGLYLAIGRAHTFSLPLHRSIPFLWAEWRRGDSIQYVGMSKELRRRIDLETHEGLCRLRQQTSELWVGIPVSQFDPSDCDGRQLRNDLKATEKATIFLLQAARNIEHRDRLPDQQITVTNRWVNAESNAPMPRPHPCWPDILHFNDRDRSAHLIWLNTAGERSEVKGFTKRQLEALCRSQRSKDLENWHKKRFEPERSYRDKWGDDRDEICSI